MKFSFLKSLPAPCITLIACEPPALPPRLIGSRGCRWPLEKLLRIHVISIGLINVWGPALGCRSQSGSGAGAHLSGGQDGSGARGDLGARGQGGPCSGCQNCPSRPGSGESLKHVRRGGYPGTNPTDPSAVTLLHLHNARSLCRPWLDVGVVLVARELAGCVSLPPSCSPRLLLDDLLCLLRSSWIARINVNRFTSRNDCRCTHGKRCTQY